MRFWILFLLLSGSYLHAQGADVPEVDSAEVLRRGDMVTVAGEGPRDDGEDALRLALAPPVDDSHKWFVTVITTKDCPACERLKSDFRKAPELLAFVAAPEEAKAWAHYNEYLAEDTTQRFRLKEYKIKAYPTIVIQPPRNGSWGDPSTVVFQVSGYGGDSKRLAASIRSSLDAYAKRMKLLGFPKEPPVNAKNTIAPSSVVVSKHGARQESPIGVDPPFAPYSPPMPVDQSFPDQYPPANQISPDGADFAVMVVKFVLSLFGGQALVNVLVIFLAVEKILNYVAPKTKTTVDDKVLELLNKLKKYFPDSDPSSPSPTPTPTPSPPAH